MAEKTAEKKNEELTIDELFEKIDEAAQSLEDSEVSLERSYELYKEGMDLLKLCSEKIDAVEKRVKVINESTDSLEVFDEDEV